MSGRVWMRRSHLLALAFSLGCAGGTARGGSSGAIEPEPAPVEPSPMICPAPRGPVESAEGIGAMDDDRDLMMADEASAIAGEESEPEARPSAATASRAPARAETVSEASVADVLDVEMALACALDAVDCDLAGTLTDELCRLAERVCAVDGETARCDDARARCRRGRARTSRACRARLD